MKHSHSEMFKVLGVETRIKIIELLKSKGPLGVKSIAEALHLTPAAISQHLKILRHAGLVSKERQGYWVPYSIEEKALEHCGGMLMEVCACGCHEQPPVKKRKMDKARLDTLIKYKQELEQELDKVQKKIARMESRKT